MQLQLYLAAFMRTSADLRKGQHTLSLLYKRSQPTRRCAQVMWYHFDNLLCPGSQADTGDRLRPRHVRADFRVSQAYSKTLLQPLPTFSRSADTCTMAATCKFCDLTTSPTSQGVGTLATVPHACGSFNFADQHRITSHTDDSAYR